MKKFKELSKIKEIIEKGSVRELNWAKYYCEIRIGSCNKPYQINLWKDLLKKVEEKIERLNFWKNL